MESTQPANQMAGPRTCRNLPLVGKNELARGALIKGSTLIPISATLRALIPTPAPAPGPPGIYTNVDL